MKKKILSGLLAFALLFGSAAALPEGAFGESTSITASAEVSGDYEYTKLDDGTVQIDKYKGSAATVIIPSTLNKLKVTKLGSRAFSNNSNITSVTIPSTVKEIGEAVFFYCNKLKSAVLSKGLKTIGNSAFEYCPSLEKVTIPDEVASIGYHAFHECCNLKTVTVPKSVTNIDDDAFGKWYDPSLYKDTNVEGFVLCCYVGSKAEEYASCAGLEYKLIDSKNPDGFEKSGAKKLSETPFKQFSDNDFGFGIFANEKNNGLYVLNKSVLYFISASTGKTSKVYDFSSLVSDSINNYFVCGNKLYAVGSRYQNRENSYSIYIFNLDTKKLIKRMSSKIAVRAVAADTKGNIFVSDGKKYICSHQQARSFLRSWSDIMAFTDSRDMMKQTETSILRAIILATMSYFLQK